MKLKLIPLLLTAVFAAVPVLGQATGPGREMTVEESYLQDSIEALIIREKARSASRENKLFALENIGQAIERGNTNEGILHTLEFLSLEGILNRTTLNRRVINDFPDVRMEAARHLGSFGTPEAVNTLIRISNIETEPMVLQQAVTSLGMIASDDYDLTISTIIRLANRFHNAVSPPDNILAFAIVEALSSIAGRNGGINDPAAWLLLTEISTGPYGPSVRERAGQVLNELRDHLFASAE